MSQSNGSQLERYWVSYLEHLREHLYELSWILFQAKETDLQCSKIVVTPTPGDAASAGRENGLPLQATWGARQLLRKTHAFLHTYLFWKGMRSQLSTSTKIYTKWHAGQIIHFLFLVGGTWGKKKKRRKEKAGLMFIFSNILNCQSILSPVVFEKPSK